MGDGVDLVAIGDAGVVTSVFVLGDGVVLAEIGAAGVATSLIVGPRFQAVLCLDHPFFRSNRVTRVAIPPCFAIQS